MGQLRDQLFLQYINKSLGQVRDEFRAKYTPKKNNRFLIKGITYEIGPCRLDDSGAFYYEISSKIPQDMLTQKTRIEKYFSEVVKMMNKAEKKPAESKMENIIHSNQDIEYKERDYVKLVYKYKESELYTTQDVEKRFKHHQSKNIPIPDIPGIATPSGKLVIALVEESMGKGARQNINNFVAANETMKKSLLAAAEQKSAKTSSAKMEKTAKPEVEPVSKPAKSVVKSADKAAPVAVAKKVPSKKTEKAVPTPKSGAKATPDKKPVTKKKK